MIASGTPGPNGLWQSGSGKYTQNYADAKTAVIAEIMSRALRAATT